MKLALSYPLNLPFGITQKFGENQLALYKDQLGLKGHNGMDLSASHGTPVYATHDGEVTFAGEDGSAGLGVVIRTMDQYDYNGGQSYFKTIYWHLKVGSIIVKPNQMVKKGELIGQADNTGLSTGDHLHFGLKPIYQGEQEWQWWNAEQDNGYAGAIDPFMYLDGTYPKDYTTKPVVDTTAFEDMQKAILKFQLSEGLNDFKNSPLTEVQFGPQTKKKANKYMTVKYK